MRFREIERSTTNPFPSLLRSLPDSPCQPPKYESDVFLSQPALAPLQTGIFPGSSRNRPIIGHAKRSGINGEAKSSFQNAKGAENRRQRIEKKNFHIKTCQLETRKKNKGFFT